MCFLLHVFFSYIFPTYVSLVPQILSAAPGLWEIWKTTQWKKLAFNKDCQSHKHFYVKAFFFPKKKRQAISPSQIPESFKTKPGCPVRNFWTERWMPTIRRGLTGGLEIIYLAWMLRKWLTPALGSGISHELLG